MAKDIEERLRSKYTLIDKSDPAAIAAAQQAGIPITDDGELVGDVDMKGFNVGSSSSAKPVPSSVTNLKKAKATSRKAKERVMCVLYVYFILYCLYYFVLYCIVLYKTSDVRTMCIFYIVLYCIR